MCVYMAYRDRTRLIVWSTRLVRGKAHESLSLGNTPHQGVFPASRGRSSFHVFGSMTEPGEEAVVTIF